MTNLDSSRFTYVVQKLFLRCTARCTLFWRCTSITKRGRRVGLIYIPARSQATTPAFELHLVQAYDGLSHGKVLPEFSAADFGSQMPAPAFVHAHVALFAVGTGWFAGPLVRRCPAEFGQINRDY